MFAFFLVEHATRRVIQVGVTRSPSDAWVAQQLRNATPNGEGPRFLVRDRDTKFGVLFERVATGSGIRVIRTPVQAPRANALCERFLGSELRRGERFTSALSGGLQRVADVLVQLGEQGRLG